jgi:hypothetical protein
MAGDRGCRGVLTLRFGRRATRTLGRRGFTVPRGERRQVVVRADRQQLRRLRRGPTRRVFVGVRVRDEAGRLGEAGDEINLARG